MNTTTIQFSIPCSVANASSLRDRISSVLRSHDYIALDLSGVTAADVTLVQLVLAGHRRARTMGRTLWVSAWSDAVAETFQRAGLPVSTFFLRD